MLAPNMTGRVYAKTGTMSGVSSLSGYAFATNHQVYAFVIFNNNFIGKVKPQTNTENQIAYILVTLNGYEEGKMYKLNQFDQTIGVTIDNCHQNK